VQKKQFEGVKSGLGQRGPRNLSRTPGCLECLVGVGLPEQGPTSLLPQFLQFGKVTVHLGGGQKILSWVSCSRELVGRTYPSWRHSQAAPALALPSSQPACSSRSSAPPALARPGLPLARPRRLPHHPKPAAGVRPARAASPPPFLLLTPPFLRAAPGSWLPGCVRKRVRPLPRPQPDPGPRLPVRRGTRGAGGLAHSQAGPAPGTGTGRSEAAAPALRRQSVRLADRSCARTWPAPPRSTREGEYAAPAGASRQRAGSAEGSGAAWPLPRPREVDGPGTWAQRGSGSGGAATALGAASPGSFPWIRFSREDRFSSLLWSAQTGQSASLESFYPPPLRLG
jgi:hypothetical protein